MNSGQKPTNGQFSQESVSAAFVMGLLKAVHQFDVGLAKKLESYLVKNGLDAQTMTDPVRRIPFNQLLDLLDTLYTQTNFKRTIALELGSRLMPASFSALGYAATSCKTLGQAIEIIPIYEKVAITLGVTQLSKKDNCLRLSWRIRGESQHHLLEEIILSAWVQLARTITASNLFPIKVMFTGPEPQNLESFKRFFGDNLAFNQSQACILFNNQLMNMNIIQFDPFINNLMKQQAGKLQNSLNTHTSLEQAVALTIGQGLVKGQLTQEYIANKHCMSLRTLRRRLHLEGTSYQKILDHLRRTKSKEYLKDINLSIFEVAMLLGYSEHSTFSAAFKRWYGTSPIAFRENNAG